jgi:hypothetical protein
VELAEQPAQRIEQAARDQLAQHALGERGAAQALQLGTRAIGQRHAAAVAASAISSAPSVRPRCSSSSIRFSQWLGSAGSSSIAERSVARALQVQAERGAIALAFVGAACARGTHAGRAWRRVFERLFGQRALSHVIQRARQIRM